MAKTLLVTGTSGRIGSEVCACFACELGDTVNASEGHSRAVFFSPRGSRCKRGRSD